MTVRILLVDDHPVVRTSLRAVLDAEADFQVVGEADCGLAAIGLARRLRPEVVLTDLLLPDVSGVTVTERIRAELPETQVVILTSMDKDDASVVRAVESGAIGYVLKSANIAELVQAIRPAANGQMHLSARAATQLIRHMHAPRNQVTLTEREREVLCGLAGGRTNKEIAQSLNIAVTTVKSHVRSILDKLGVDSRTQAALYAVRAQLLSPEEVQAA
jgi:DNA-binding NarL/FixJ family response regulator